MKNLMIAAALFASCSLAFAQTATSSVQGQVLNASTGAPVKRAAVSLRQARTLANSSNQGIPNSGGAVETDNEGNFVLANLMPGGYQLIVQRQGFVDFMQRPGYYSQSLLMVGEGQKLTGMVVRITPQSVISGKVLDLDGEGLANVPISVIRAMPLSTPGLSNRGVINTTTNDIGEYRAAGLTAGRYLVMAGTPRPGNSYFVNTPQPSEGPQFTYVNTYYPTTMDEAKAIPVKVGSGTEVRGTDIKLVKTKGFSVSGQIIDPGATAERSTFPMLIPRRSPTGMGYSSVGRMRSFSGGSFQIDEVPPGSYVLAARRSGDQGRVVAAASLEVEITDKNIDGLTLQVASAGEVDVVTKSEPPGRCTTAYLSLNDEAMYNSVSSVDVGSQAKTVIKNVIPGKYTWNLSNSGNCYLRSIRFAGGELTDNHVKVDGRGPLELTLAVSDTRIEGTVEDSSGKPVRNATVALLPKDGVPWQSRTANAGSTGAFVLPGLPPGTYDVLAWEAVEYNLVQSSDYVKNFAGQGKSVVLEASGRQSLRLTAIPAAATGEPTPAPPFPVAKGSLEGRVVNATNGTPLSGVKVTLGAQAPRRSMPGAQPMGMVGGILNGQTPPPDVTVETDAQGRFAIRDIEPEFYYISGERQGFSAVMSPAAPYVAGEQLVVGNGQSIAAYTLKLAPQSVITGKVSDEFGEAVPNAQVTLYKPEYVRGSRRLPRLGGTQTDDLGKFRLSGVVPGTYYLSVGKRPTQMRMAQGSNEPQPDAAGLGYGTTWFPNAPDFAGATPVVVAAAGAEVPLEIVMRRTRVVGVRGTVIDDAGASGGRIMVDLTPRGLGTVTSIGTSAVTPDGGFDVPNVPAGSYILTARVFGSSGPQHMGFLPVEVHDVNLDGLKVHMVAGKEVRGAIKSDTTGPVYGNVSGSAAEGYSTSSNMVQSGAFVLRSVWPLTYTLDVRGLCANCYLKQLRYGGRDVPDTAVDFSGDGELEVLIGTNAAALDVVAVNAQGQPAAGATLMLTPAEGPWRVLIGQTDGRGACHFESLRPGAYRVLVFEGAAPDALPETLAPYQSKATKVTLQESGKENARIVTIAK